MKVKFSEIKKLMDEGFSGYEIAKKLNLNPTSLYQRVWRAGLRFDSNVVDVDADEIKRLYVEGNSMKEIADYLNVSVKVVFNRLRGFSKKRSVGPVAMLDNGFFSNIDSFEKAYWLGFVFADGSIVGGKTGRRFQVGLAKKDKDHLLLLKSSLKSKNRLYYNKKEKSFTLSVSSKRLTEDLIKLGCVERKSYKKIDVPKINKEYLWSFWRGYFDGDGSISFSGRGRKSLQIRLFCSCRSFLKEFCDFLKGEGFDDLPKSCLFKSDVWIVQLYGDNAKRVLEKFYKDGCIFYLKRKFVKYSEWKRTHLINELKEKKNDFDFEIKEVNFDKEIKDFFLRYHYSKTFPPTVKKVLVAEHSGEIIGAILLGYGVYPRHSVKKIFPSVKMEEYYEIGRMCFLDGIPKGFGSRFLSEVSSWIKQNCKDIKVIFTWADGVFGKAGFVYQAASYLYFGYIWTRRYLDSSGKIIHPKATKGFCKEAGDVNWLPESFMRKKGLSMIKGKQFRYVFFVCGSLEKKRILKKAVIKPLPYPKKEDLVLKRLVGGKWVKL